jgi:hypothetical protein
VGVGKDRSANRAPKAVPEADWWRGAVIYQIYPRSYADSDGGHGGTTIVDPSKAAGASAARPHQFIAAMAELAGSARRGGSHGRRAVGERAHAALAATDDRLTAAARAEPTSA